MDKNIIEYLGKCFYKPVDHPGVWGFAKYAKGKNYIETDIGCYWCNFDNKNLQSQCHNLENKINNLINNPSILKLLRKIKEYSNPNTASTIVTTIGNYGSAN